MHGVPLISIVEDDDSLRNSLDNLIRSVRISGARFRFCGSLLELKSSA